MKNPLTPAGIEPATYRIVAQHLNHWATAVPISKRRSVNSSRRRRRHEPSKRLEAVTQRHGVTPVRCTNCSHIPFPLSRVNFQQIKRAIWQPAHCILPPTVHTFHSRCHALTSGKSSAQYGSQRIAFCLNTALFPSIKNGRQRCDVPEWLVDRMCSVQSNL